MKAEEPITPTGRAGMRRRIAGFFFLLLVVGGIGLRGLAQEKEPGGSIRGLVEDEKGQPKAGIKVRAINRRTNELAAESVTGEKGEFLLENLTPARYALVFSSPEYQQAVISSVEVRAGRETRLERPIRLQPVEMTAAIIGATFDPNGFLLPGVRVVLERIPIEGEQIKPLKLEEVSNSSGEFAFRLPGERARYRLTASARGFEPETQIVDVAGGERRRVAIQLKTRSKK